MNKILVSPIHIIVKLIPLAMLVACASPNPQLSGLTPIPSLAPGATQTPLAALQAASVQTALPTMLPAKNDGAAVGAHLFIENCTPCHGNQGQGVDAPNLRNSDYVQTAGDQALYETIALGRSGTEMPAWLQENGGPLTDPQIGEIVAYLHTLQGVSSLPAVSPPPEEPAPTPIPAGAPTPEPAQPSNPGSTGPAVNLSGDVKQGMASFGPYCAPCHGPQGVQGIPNPGSDDGSVPAINPIDPTIVNQDANLFAANLDLFIEHGSVPEGSNPRLVMPSFGDSQMLTPQQISNLIAYIMSLNGVSGD